MSGLNDNVPKSFEWQTKSWYGDNDKVEPLSLPALLYAYHNVRIWGIHKALQTINHNMPMINPSLVLEYFYDIISCIAMFTMWC